MSKVSNNMHLVRTCLIMCLFNFMPIVAWAHDSYTIVIKNHRFDPPQLTIPANKKVKLLIDNQDPTPEEFESFDLNREKIIGANKQGVVFVGPLKPGNYKFFGEFNQKTAQGLIIVE